MLTARLLRFGPFELDVRAGEMRKHGIRIRLQDQSFQILLMLVERPGEVVLREEIRLQLWPNNTIVEFDHSINAAIKRLRNALGESAEDPRYIETLAKRGYRFRGEVERVGEPAPPAEPAPAPESEAAAPDGLNGKALSHYRILGKLGEGGMGVVYRAEDLQLGRQVALKFLPCATGELPESILRRFEREARAAAVLNHPHICTIYGLEDLDGQPAIVMELVEGETLAARLAKGPLPLDVALPVAAQIADALAEAHRRGVIHRDLKPANIMLTGPKGRPTVKVLDFGLAKIVEPVAVGLAADALTERGVVAGTLAYMSPEQVEGKEADARSDIFSFGLVLYEMITGQRAFRASSRATEIAAILEREPPVFAPEGLNPVVRACVAKDPDERFQSARDVKLALEWSVARSASPAPRSPRKWIPWAAAAFFAALAILIGLRDRPRNTARLALTIPQAGATDQWNPNFTPEISPDGSSVLLGGRSQLWVRRLSSLEPRSVGSITNEPVIWSPDSRWVVFRQADRLVKVRLPDGPPELVARLDSPSRGGSWSESGTILVSFNSVRALGLFAVPASGGEFKPVEMAGIKAGNYLWPRFLPGGDDFLFLLDPRGGEAAEIYLATLRNGKVINPVLLMKNDTAVAYTPAGGGRVLFVQNDNLFSQRLDRRGRRLVGEAELVQTGVFSIPQLSRATFSVSRSGAIAWRPGRAALNQVTIFDRHGKEIGTAGPPGSFSDIALSPDETRLLCGGSLLEPGKPGRVSLGTGWSWDLWSPDGSRLIGARGSSHWLAERSADGASEPWEIRPIPDGATGYQDVSPDGKEVLVMLGPQGAVSLSIEKPDRDGNPKPTLTVAEPFPRTRFSPDGRWIVYVLSDGSAYVQPFPGPGLRTQIAAVRGYPAWRKDGKEIVIADRRGVWSVTVERAGSGLRFGRPELLFSGLRWTNGMVGASLPLAVSRDGSRIYFAQAVEQPADSAVINILMGWAGK